MYDLLFGVIMYIGIYNYRGRIRMTMPMKELMRHSFAIKEYGYDLSTVAKAYDELPENTKEKALYLKDLRRYSDNINSISKIISKIIESEEEKENEKEEFKVK